MSGTTQEADENKISEDMLKEVEICVVTYFSFHWQHVSAIIEKVCGLLTRHPFCALSPSDE